MRLMATAVVLAALILGSSLLGSVYLYNEEADQRADCENAVTLVQTKWEQFILKENALDGCGVELDE